MSPKKIKRAAELLDALEGLIEVRDCPGEKCEAAQIAAVHDICEAGNCIGARTYLPVDIGAAMIKFAIGHITAELTGMGVEVPA